VRPEPGTRVVLPTGNFDQECIVLDQSEDAFGMVAARTTRQYTTKDAFGFSVRHPKGERVLFQPLADQPESAPVEHYAPSKDVAAKGCPACFGVEGFPHCADCHGRAKWSDRFARGEGGQTPIRDAFAAGWDAREAREARPDGVDLRRFSEALDSAVQAALPAQSVADKVWQDRNDRWVPLPAIESAAAGLPCPMRSSLTDEPCVLTWGHEPAGPERFHRFAALPLDAVLAALSGDEEAPEPERTWFDGPLLPDGEALPREPECTCDWKHLMTGEGHELGCPAVYR
jgi:hypothetical protein